MVYLDDPTKIYRHWKEYTYFKKAHQVAAAMLGQRVWHREDQVIIKPPMCVEETPWHQDVAYWWRLGVEVQHGVVCWLALSDTSPQSGGLQFVRGSHRHGPLKHVDVSQQWELPDALEAQVGNARPVKPVLRPGDATFHHYRTLHYSASNTTARPRIALSTHFWGTPTNVAAGAKPKRHFGERRSGDALEN